MRGILGQGTATVRCWKPTRSLPTVTVSEPLPATTSAAMGGLPLGLAHDVKLVRPVKQGQSLTWDDVAVDTSTDAYRVRRQMEAAFKPPA